MLKSQTSYNLEWIEYIVLYYILYKITLASSST